MARIASIASPISSILETDIKHFWGEINTPFIKAMHFSLYPLNELRNLATKNYSHLTAFIQAPFRKRATGYCSTAHLNDSPRIAAINSERVIKFTVIFKRACMHVKTNPFSTNRSSNTMLHLYASLVAFVFCSGEVLLCLHMNCAFFLSVNSKK